MSRLPLLLAEVQSDPNLWDDWVWWGGYLVLAVVGGALAYRRDVRRGLLRLLAPHLSPRSFRIARRLLFERMLWLAVWVLSLFGLVLLFGSVLMYVLESRANPSFASLEEASHSTLIYLVSGAEDRQPRTPWGWRCFGLIAITGLGLTAYFTGNFVSELLFRGRRVMDRDVARQSFLVIGWNPRARQIIEELFRAFEVGLARHLITVLSDRKVDPSRVADLDSRGVTFVTGDAFDKKVLERLGAHEARAVVILANRTVQDPDGHSAVIVLALTGLFKDEQLTPERRPRICVEVVNHRKTALIRDAGADDTICHEDYGLGVLAQSALVSSIGEVYQELLAYAPETNEFHVLRSPATAGAPSDIPAEVWERLLKGKSFREAADVFNRARDDRNPVILVGLRRGGRLLLNPLEPERVQPGDELLTIARGFPTLEPLRRLIAE
jgi:voltage-gated potassium channel Kch